LTGLKTKTCAQNNDDNVLENPPTARQLTL
jgi:hypothetical protein